jgi:uncharacterized membrane protein YdbT with pleckstrin-like domain
MPFSPRHLNDGETLVLDLHPHWWFFGPESISLVASMFATLYLRSKVSGWLESTVTYVGLAAIIVSMSWLIVALIKWRTTYFVVTSHRLIYRQGVVARNGVEIPLERVNNVNFEQSIFERLLQVGDLLVESGGQEGQQVFSDIARPEEVQNIIHSTIQRDKNQRSEGAPSLAGIAHELERLEGLRDRGVLTDEEFEEQKRRLID